MTRYVPEYCHFCGLKFRTSVGGSKHEKFRWHIQNVHGVTAKEHFDAVNQYAIPKCEICGKECLFSEQYHRYWNYCSTKCKQKRNANTPLAREAIEKRQANFKMTEDGKRRLSFKMSEQNRRQWRDPEYAKRITDQTMAMLRDPNNKFGYSKGISKYQGNSMRSSLEVRFAMLLDANGILWEYEPKTFMLPLFRYTPDFFLPEDNLWVEIKPANMIDERVVLKKSEFEKHTGCCLHLISPDNYATFVDSMCFRRSST